MMFVFRVLCHLSRLLLPPAEPSTVHVDLGGRCVCGHNQIDHVDRDTWCQGKVCGCSIYEPRPDWLDKPIPTPDPPADDVDRVDPDGHPLHVDHSVPMPAALAAWWGLAGEVA